MKGIKIGDKLVAKEQPPFIIAEMSGNHNQSLERALQIVDEAAKSGAHALKLQTYTADTMTLNIKEGDFYISDKKSPWFGRSLYELYQDAHTPWEWHRPIIERCKKHGLLWLSTPFDATAVDFLEELDIPCYKIASFENTDLNLIRRVAATKKPVIISTGMASVGEMMEMVEACRSQGNTDVILLKCTSSYPSTPENSNILSIPHMQELFGVEVGLSDHTLGIGVAVASVAVGCRLIEKHFTLSRAEGGVDSQFSLEPQEMKLLVDESLKAWQGLGSISYGTLKTEEGSKVFRRSIYISEDIKKGEHLTTKNVRTIRPGFGLPPKYYDKVLGMKAVKDLKRGQALSWDLIGR